MSNRHAIDAQTRNQMGLDDVASQLNVFSTRKRTTIKVHEMMELLAQQNPNAEVSTVRQPHWPTEHGIVEILARETIFGLLLTCTVACSVRIG